MQNCESHIIHSSHTLNIFNLNFRVVYWEGESSENTSYMDSSSLLFINLMSTADRSRRGNERNVTERRENQSVW